VQADQFGERLEAVRKRFASSLENKISETRAELPSFLEGAPNAVDSVANAYRRIHGIRGVGAAIGFAATGRAARAVEDVMTAAYRGSRGLAAAEITGLDTALRDLAIAAQAELRATFMSSPAKNEG
jgi:chemotaxis protein histidine kinase CheA